MGDVFGQNDLPVFQSLDAFFVGRDHGRNGRIGDAVKELLHLFADLRQFGLQRLDTGCARGKAMVPQVLEHGPRRLQQVGRGLHPFQQVHELPFDHVAADGLPIAFAAARTAQIVGVIAHAPFRPAGRQRRAAIPAHHGPAQREIRIQVLTGRGAGVAVDALLNLHQRFIADKGFMLALAQRHVPIGCPDIPGIDRARQNVRHLLGADVALAVAGELGEGLQKAHDFGL
ncbi:hypothetical protein QOZ23_04550 [Pseudomonas aeruginosa]